MLRIGERRFLRVHAEELRVELIDIVENGPRFDEVGGLSNVFAEAIFELGFAEAGDRLHAGDQIPPELTDRIGARPSSGHSDDGDRARNIRLLVFRLARTH